MDHLAKLEKNVSLSITSELTSEDVYMGPVSETMASWILGNSLALFGMKSRFGKRLNM
jgi:hypothetical protein